MQRRRFGLGGSSALTWTLGFAVVAACSVYDASLLTGGSGGQGGTSNAGEGGEGASTGGDGGTSNQGGGSGGSGASGGTGVTGGSGNGGGSGGSAGMTGGNGGSDPAGGEGGESGTAGSAGSDGLGGSAGSGGSGGSGGDAGSGGACGKCGCGMPETDTDGDSVPDCIDICENLDDVHCTALRDGLAHRYSFSGTGTVATDSKGGQDGEILNATLSGSGTLTLTGGTTTSPPYVNLPNGIISGLTNATFETWLTWNQSGTSNQSWQRIFDFGTSGTEDFAPNASPSTAGTTYVFVTSRAGVSPNVLRGVFSTTGVNGEMPVNAAAALPTATRQHVALVFDDENDSLTLYLNGAPQNAILSFTGQLSQISDVNNWLGRSQYSNDPELNATFDEFRIYDVALTPTQIETSATAGPDATFLE